MFVVITMFTCLIDKASLLPVTPNQYCPVINESDLEPSVGPSAIGSKIIRMDEVEGNKVRLQFYYPSINRQRQIESSSSAEATSTVAVPQNDSSGEMTTNTGMGDEGTTTIPSDSQPDIMCQWDFRVSYIQQ
jgi:hypothetical protein